MRLQPLDLLGGCYTDDTLSWSAQDTVNWLPEIAEVNGTRTAMRLSAAPGLQLFADLSNDVIRGLHNVEGRLFVVAGPALYQVNATGQATQIGEIPGVGRVQMAHNQINEGNQLLIANGESGGGYVWDTVKKVFTHISAAAYPGAKALAYMDSYLLQVEPFGRYWFFSGLANATDYRTNDRMESEASPDTIVHLAVSQHEVVVFNQTTIEFFRNTGAQSGTFQNVGALIERGCASGNTVAKLDNSLFWLGDDGVVYRLDGYQAVPVSTGPIERALAKADWEQAFAFSWEDRHHKVYCLSCPDGQTWGYDVVTRLWHRRASLGINHWRVSHLVRWNGRWIAGDLKSGKLWTVVGGTMREGDQPIVCERVSGVLHDQQARVIANTVELLVNAGSATSAPSPTESATYLSSKPYPLTSDGNTLAIAVAPVSGQLRTSKITVPTLSDRLSVDVVPRGGVLRGAVTHASVPKDHSITVSVAPRSGHLGVALKNVGVPHEAVSVAIQPRSGVMRDALIRTQITHSQIAIAVEPKGGTLG